MLGRRKLLVLRIPAFVLTCLLVVGCSAASKHEPNVDALIEQLAEGTIEERDQAALALIDCGDKSETRLRAMLADSNSRDRRLLSDILDQIAVPKALRGLVPPVRRVTILATNQDLRDVLEEFQAQTQIPLDMPRQPTGREISISIRNAAPLEALQAICKAANLSWTYENWSGMSMGPSEPKEPYEPKVTLHPGPQIEFHKGRPQRPTEMIFLRHYAVEIVEFNLMPSTSRKGLRAVLNFGLHWPAGVNPHVVDFQINSVVDDRGRELPVGHDDPNEPKGPRREPQWQVPWHRLYYRCRLRHPGPDVQALASIRGTARFHYLLRSKSISFPSLEMSVGLRMESQGVEVEVLDLKPVDGQPGNSCLNARFRISGLGSGIVGRMVWDLPDGRTSEARMMRITDASRGIYESGIMGQQARSMSFKILVDTCVEDKVDFEFKHVGVPAKAYDPDRR